MPLQEQPRQLLFTFYQVLFFLLNPVFLIPTILLIVCLIKFLIAVKKHTEYKKCAYYQITKLPYSSVIHDTGKFGEYLTYKHLKGFEAEGAKFLFNLYIPKEDGGTSEIDVLMICAKGLFVFESKNYSGWVFGNESHKDWCQTLPSGRGEVHKEHFYNPVLQNRSHIKHLQTLLGEQLPMYSIVIFSDRCELKNVQVKSQDVHVIHRCDVASVVSTIFCKTPTDILSKEAILDLYNRLYPYTQVDTNTKELHIASIHAALNPYPIEQPASQTAPCQVHTELPISKTSLSEDNTSIMGDVTEGKVAHVDSKTPDPIPSIPEVNESQTRRCPRCNGELVLRTATKGVYAGNQFYGCSNYPKCKYIQKINQTTL